MPHSDSPRRPRRAALVLALPLFALLGAPLSPGRAGAAPAGLRAGERLPYFRCSWLDGSEAPGSPELLSEADATTLVVWNRECPRCTGLALQCDRLADSLRAAGGIVIGLLFGPDDPSALRDRLAAEGIRTPHLWDPSGLVARDLRMGDAHLGVFVVDRSGTILASFDDEIPDLPGPVLSAWRSWRARAASAVDPGDQVERAPAAHPHGAAAPPVAPSLPASLRGPRLSLEGRFRLSGAEGTRSGDTGISGEPLEGGALALTRWDFRAHAEVAPGIDFVPRLRISNEDEAVLREGAEPWASRYGTASLELRRGRLRATAGAFREAIAPLVLQRWDPEDAPPPAGSSGCACGTGGVAGLSQRSLEILGPEYALEGLSVGWAGRWARPRLLTAVTRWEEVSRSLDPEVARAESRFRRVLSAAVLDLGAIGGAGPIGGSGSPLGARLSRVRVEDDRRSVDRRRSVLPGLEQDEASWSLWLSLRPVPGVRLEGERAWWTREEIVRQAATDGGQKRKTEARALRAGGAWERPLGRSILSGRLHWIRTDPGFDPAYRALTYSADREGWRASLGASLRDGTGARERLALEAFHRAVREAQDDPLRRALPGWGRIRERLTGLALRVEPRRPLAAEADLVLSEVDWPIPILADERKASGTLLLRWRQWPGLDPWLRCDWIRYREGFGPAHSATQISLGLRVLS